MELPNSSEAANLSLSPDAREDVLRAAVVVKMAPAIEPPDPESTWLFACLSKLPNPNLPEARTTAEAIDNATSIAECMRHVALGLKQCKGALDVPRTTLSNAAFPYLVALRGGPTLGNPSPPVCVAASAIHGNGVFATRDIKQNELVTTYPVHALRVHMNRLPSQECKHPFAVVYRDKSLHGSHYLEWEDYKMNGIGVPENAICFYGDPSVHTPGACGHLINDPENSGRRANCIAAPLVGGVVTAIMVTRAVKSGEELLMRYGAGYWEDRHRYLRPG